MAGIDVNGILAKGTELAASDVHFQTGSRVGYRIHGQLRFLNMQPLAKKQVEGFLHEVLGEERWQALRRDGAVDCAYEIDRETRFRLSAYMQRQLPAATFRILPSTIPAIDTLRLPPAVVQFGDEERGLVLVTGTTGSGKTTTLAALVDYINTNHARKIVTIEDPIEYVHSDKRCLISQREVGTDTPSFREALRRALRQDPDVILIGELRDYETMATAIRAADTGHLVFSTMHTTNATQTLQRLTAMFPPEERELLTIQLASNLVGVASMRLAHLAHKEGRIPVVEIMQSTPIVEKLIMEGRLAQLPSVLTSGEMGMQSFDQHLVDLVQEDLILRREALRLASNPELVARGFDGISGGQMGGGIISG